MTFKDKMIFYKENLGFKSLFEFDRAIGVNEGWLSDQLKKKEIKVIDIQNYICLSKYLGISLNDLLDDNYDIILDEKKQIEIKNINVNCDINIIIDELKELSNCDNVKFNDIPLTKASSKILKDSLDVVKILIKQNL